MEVKVSQAIVEILEREGITAAFGIPGAGINGLYRDLAKSKKIVHFTHRHEEACVHAAGGYYRASGKMAVALCTSGPGATNFVTGLYTANIDSIPLVAISGQAVRAQMGKDAFQCVDIAAIAAPVAKKTWCITDPEAVPAILREAFLTAREGKPGPVLLDLPLDVQNATISLSIEEYTPALPQKPAPAMEQVKQALSLIRSATAPVMIVGGGVVEAGGTETCIKLAERLQMPVITTYMAKGAIPIHHPLNAGHAGIQVGGPLGNRVLSESDVVLGIGCRFTDRHTGALPEYRGNRKFIHVNIQEKELSKIFPADLTIHADAALFAEMLLALADKETPPCRDAAAYLAPLRETLQRKTDHSCVPIHPHRVFGEINKAFDSETLFTTGCGITQIWSGQLQEIDKPRQYLPSGGAGCLGYDIPAAFGAMVSQPGKRGVCLMGDFGFTFHAQELAVCAKYNQPVIVVIVNNAYLGLIRQNQKYAYGYEYAVEMGENHGLIDYVTVARGFGCEGERVFRPEELAGAFQRAQHSLKPYVIDIVVEPSADCSMGTSIENVVEH